MNIRIPQPTQAARLLKKFFASLNIEISHAQALEAVARLHGYQNQQAMKADACFAEPPVLKPVSSNEYELREAERTVWVSVAGISVHIAKNDEGVSVDMFAKGHEDNSLATTYLFFDEVNEALEEAPAEPGRRERDFIVSDIHGSQDATLKVLKDVGYSTKLDGPEFHGVYGSAEDYPCGEITLGETQPCELSGPEFTPGPVDWNAVSEYVDISHIRINKTDLRQLTYRDNQMLAMYARGDDSISRRGMGNITIFGYINEKGRGESIKLATLVGAVEEEEGLIRLANGKLLELVTTDLQGQLCRVSPQTDAIFKL